MTTKWATQVEERVIAVHSPAIEEYLEDEVPSIDSPLPERERPRFLKRMVDTLGRFFLGVDPRGLLLPLGLRFHSSRSRSFREKAWLDTFWNYGIFF